MKNSYLQVVITPGGSLGDHDSIAWAWAIGVTETRS